MRFTILLFMLISINGYSQLKSYILNRSGDTLNRVDMKGYKQGPWSVNIPDLRGERGYEEEGYYENDLKEGTWKKFSLEGVKIAEENYRWGKLNGKQEYFTYNGGLLRVESWRAIDPANAYDTVSVYDLNDPTREINRVVVKNDGIALKHGKWLYFDPREGTVEGTEMYVMGKIQTDDGSIAGEDDIRPLEVSKGKQPQMSDSLRRATDPTLLKIKEYEKQNSGKKTIKVRNGNTGMLPEPSPEPRP